jgi:hypothetical protein
MVTRWFGRTARAAGASSLRSICAADGIADWADARVGEQSKASAKAAIWRRVGMDMSSVELVE